jgi:beta-fructofuranosidase
MPCTFEVGPLHLSRRAAVLAVSLAPVFGPRTGHAFQSFDFDQRYLVQPGFIIKDHCLVPAAGDTFHVFYIKADQSVPESETAKSLGHATTMDLKHWTFHPDVIPCVPGTWEEQFVWAPHIVSKTSGGSAPAEYYMFYTGVNRFRAQATGVAVSNDLYHWVKSPLNPVYQPSTTWAAWSESTYSSCRDPFVFEKDGLWHLLNTAWTLDSRGAIAHAVSQDLYEWKD